MTTVVDAAPALLPSESPAGDTTASPAAGGHSEALIIAAVLAEHGGPLGAIRHMTDHAVRDMVKRVLDHHSHSHVVDWRRRVPPPEWSIRWDVARDVAARVYGGHVPRVDALTDVYTAFETEPAEDTSS